MRYEYLGGFMAYEVITDLRHTYLLENAPDIMTWCNLGPGAKRGIGRVLFPQDWNDRLRSSGGKVDSKTTFPVPEDWEELLGQLMEELQNLLPDNFPVLEMRDIEHSLCELDKYDRVLFNQGPMKRRYNGGA